MKLYSWRKHTAQYLAEMSVRIPRIKFSEKVSTPFSGDTTTHTVSFPTQLVISTNDHRPEQYGFYFVCILFGFGISFEIREFYGQ